MATRGVWGRYKQYNNKGLLALYDDDDASDENHKIGRVHDLEQKK